MNARRLRISIFFALFFLPLITIANSSNSDTSLALNELGYFEERGLTILVFSNWYDGNFSDAKMCGIEIIHHEVRTATNGDVRLSSTPGQWDPIPNLVGRDVNRENNRIDVSLSYPNDGLDYMIRAEEQGGGILISVNLKKPLPPQLEGRAGFNLEFLLFGLL